MLHCIEGAEAAAVKERFLNRNGASVRGDPERKNGYRVLKHKKVLNEDGRWERFIKTIFGVLINCSEKNCSKKFRTVAVFSTEVPKTQLQLY